MKHGKDVWKDNKEIRFVFLVKSTTDSCLRSELRGLCVHHFPASTQTLLIHSG